MGKFKEYTPDNDKDYECDCINECTEEICEDEPEGCIGEVLTPSSSSKTVKKDNEKGLVMAASQWSDVNGCIVTAANTFSKIEPGYYTLHS